MRHFDPQILLQILYYIGTALLQSIPVVIAVTSSMGIRRRFAATASAILSALFTGVLVVSIYALSYVLLSALISALLWHL